MLKLETISQEMREEAVKILGRMIPKSQKTKDAIKIFQNGSKIRAAFQNDDPWTSCVLEVSGKVVAMGAAKRCTYAKQEDKPNSGTGHQVAWSRTVRNFRRG